MNRLIRIAITMSIGLVASIITGGILGFVSHASLFTVLLIAELAIPFMIAAICIEEIIFARLLGRIIAAVILAIVLTGTALYLVLDAHEASVTYCHGKPVSQWTSPLPSDCRAVDPNYPSTPTDDGPAGSNPTITLLDR